MPSSVGPHSQPYDVVVVGYGPTGMVLGGLLGQAGYRVAIVEAYTSLYNLPRAATFDDEIMRTFQKLGRAGAIGQGAKVQTTYEWRNGAGELLIEHQFDERGRSGWAEWYMMYQPLVEDILDGLCRGLDNVDIFQGQRVVELTDDPAVIAVGADGETILVRGRFVVGCDGGNSFVRDAIGAELDDYGFEARWLVSDFRIIQPLNVPAALQVCDPEQPAAIIRIGHDHQRFSFMLHPEETIEEATDPEKVWQRVGRWVTADDVELERIAYYTFRSLISRTWSHGGVFLAGDAAHQMPPFLGQGMCSGIRDAHNLAWKLDLVLSGASDASLLHSYQLEREPHVRAITEMAIELGRIQTLRDPVAASERDARWIALRAQRAEPDRLVFPGLSGGLIDARVPDPRRPASAGELFIQAHVEVDGRRGLFDDCIGQGFAVITRGRAPLVALDELTAGQLARIGARVAWFGPDDDGPSTDGNAAHFIDLDGEYGRWFDERGCSAVIVRPDWYVYGVADGVEPLSVLLDHLAASIVPVTTIS